MVPSCGGVEGVAVPLVEAIEPFEEDGTTARFGEVVLVLSDAVSATGAGPGESAVEG